MDPAAFAAHLVPFECRVVLVRTEWVRVDSVLYATGSPDLHFLAYKVMLDLVHLTL